MNIIFKVASVSLLSVSGLFLGQTHSLADSCRVNQVVSRIHNQEARIVQGHRNGTLTGNQTQALFNLETGLTKEEQHMRANDGGNLTPNEQAIVNRQENQVSARIYANKH